jgi:heterodisulfide reductase subunit C
LSQRKPQHLSKQRALSSNSKAASEYFGKVEKLLEDLHIKDAEDLDKRLWNCDECGMCTAVASTAILARRGSKWVHETAGGLGG